MHDKNMKFNNSTPELAAECDNPDTKKCKAIWLLTYYFFKSLPQSNIRTVSKGHQMFYRHTSSTKRPNKREG